MSGCAILIDTSIRTSFVHDKPVFLFEDSCMLFPLMAYRGRTGDVAWRKASATIRRTNYEFFPAAHRHPVPSLCRLLPVLITDLADSERMHTNTTHPAFYKRLIIAHTCTGGTFYRGGIKLIICGRNIRFNDYFNLLERLSNRHYRISKI